MPKSPVSHKISKLVREGVPHRQAVAIALSMDAQNRLGPLGGYKRVRRSRSPMRRSRMRRRSPVQSIDMIVIKPIRKRTSKKKSRSRCRYGRKKSGGCKKKPGRKSR